MSAMVLGPIVPFVALLFTRWRWVAIASAAAGYAAGFWVAGIVFPFAQRGWMWWVLLGYASVVSGAMAVAETLVATILQRGRPFRALLWSFLAHAAFLAVVFGLHTSRPLPRTLLMIQAAMLGAAAATLGARRRKPAPPPTSTSSG